MNCEEIRRLGLLKEEIGLEELDREEVRVVAGREDVAVLPLMPEGFFRCRWNRVRVTEDVRQTETNVAEEDSREVVGGVVVLGHSPGREICKGDEAPY